MQVPQLFSALKTALRSTADSAEKEHKRGGEGPESTKTPWETKSKYSTIKHNKHEESDLD